MGITAIQHRMVRYPPGVSCWSKAAVMGRCWVSCPGDQNPYWVNELGACQTGACSEMDDPVGVGCALERGGEIIKKEGVLCWEGRGGENSSPCLALLPWEAALPVSFRLTSSCPTVSLIPVLISAAVGCEGDLSLLHSSLPLSSLPCQLSEPWTP